MKLSTRSRYGTRLMLELALKHGQGPILLKDIAQTEEISEKYLGQLIIPLKSSGLVNSTRGSKGGYELSRAPRMITILDIVQVLEGDIKIVDCLNDEADCKRSQKCVTKMVWSMVQEQIQQVLQGITLDDLVKDLHEQELQAVMYNI